MEFFSFFSKENISWIFGGLGTSILAAITGAIFNSKRKSSVNMSIKSGDNCQNYQAHEGSIIVKSERDKDDKQ